MEDAMAGQNPKGKFKCQACTVSFTSKKMYEKHRKTVFHKDMEKRNREAKTDAMASMELKAAFSLSGSKGFPSTMFDKAKNAGIKIVGNCSACEVEFVSRLDMMQHQETIHKSTIQYGLASEVARDLSRSSWRNVFSGVNGDASMLYEQECKYCDYKAIDAKNLHYHFLRAHSCLMQC